MRSRYVLATSAALALTGTARWTHAAADASAEGSTELEEIVITAQKRTEKLQDVPVAAQVVSAQALAQANVADLSDLNNLVPSVQLNGTINGRVPTGIRGISSVSNEQTVGISSGVAVNIDGVPVPSDSFDANNVRGIQNIEVLLGPQSTLGGRTAASGLINLTTRGPTDTAQGFATVTATDDNEYRVEAFVSGPILDRLDGSLSVWKSTTPYPVTNLATGDKTTQDISGARAKLLFKVTDDLDVTLMAHNENTQGHGFNFVYSYITPGASLLGAPPLSQAVLLPGITPSPNNLVYSSPVTTAGGSHRDKDYSLIIDWRLPGGYVVTSTTAYQHEDQDQVQDLFAVNEYFWNVLTQGHAPPFNDTQHQLTTVTSKSEELKIVSPADQTLSFLAGIFYSDVRVDELYTRDLLPAQIDDHVVPDTKTTDAYARATLKFTPATSVVAGLRFNHDEIGYDYDEVVDAVVFPTEVVGPYHSSGSSSSNTVVGDIALKQQFTDNVMGYVSYSRGYSPAAYNTSAVLFSNAPLQPVGKESINSYEIGTKGTFLERTLTLNADIFDTVYTNYQIQSYSAVPGAITPPLELASAGKAQTRGAELNVDWLAAPLTRVSFSGAYIDAKFVTYSDAPCYGLQAAGCNPVTLNGQLQDVQNVSGDTMPNSPKFKGSLSAEQRAPLGGSAYELAFRGTYTYRTSAQMLPDQNPFAIQRGFGLLDLSAAVQTRDQKFSARLFVKNLTNHHYFTDVEDFWTGPWASNAVIGQPARDSERYAGVELTAAF
ncbi:MAG TPA: TonB-dependent receptor [Steroidobacteraceae bacterium]|jgi:iron complex outermembrane receptor protein|nr:TonB-dependent receptor [Steroidobacteraceae bacterium]